MLEVEWRSVKHESLMSSSLPVGTVNCGSGIRKTGLGQKNGPLTSESQRAETEPRRLIQI